MSLPKVVITGGGTGGHVFPAIAIAEELHRRGFEILYVGTSRGLEAKIVPAKGFRFFSIKSGQVKNQSFLKIAGTVLQLILGILSCVRLFLREKPLAVIGVGGYVSAPACIAGWLLRVPLFLQEQNVSVGIANRLLGKIATEIFLGFEQAKSCFPAAKCTVTGNPLRRELSGDGFPAYEPNSRFLLVMGGSLGAHAINEAMVSLLPQLQESFPGIVIFHQTGPKDHPAVLEAYRKSFHNPFDVVPFIEDMPAVYAKAALVVARSGALTVSELIQVGRPAVFVPYPRKGQNDQTANAYMLQNAGAARVVEQGENFTERLWSSLRDTFQGEKLVQMAAGYSRLRTSGATATIGDRVARRLEPPTTGS